MRKFRAITLASLLAIAFLTAGEWMRAQLPSGLSGKRFALPWQDKETSELKGILTGQNAKQISGSQVLVTDFGMRTFRNGNTNNVELIAEAPECFVDRANSTASSPGKVRAYTANTNIYIEGEGFFCQQSNAVLIISNKVQTIIRKELLKSRAGENKSEPPVLLETDGTNEVLNIFADHFQFFYESNLVSYTGNVRVEDTQMELTTDVLNVYFSTNKTLEQITAENGVVITGKNDNSHATGKRATYTIDGEDETMALIGNPSWSDGQQEGKADVFIFDRASGIFHAKTNAVFKVPRNKIGAPGFLSAGQTSQTNLPVGKPVVITADTISFSLPQTNRPVREMIAEKNVVITSEEDQSRAKADRLVYNETTGVVELTGNPVWKIKDSVIAAEVLTIDRTNQVLGARRNVQMTIPAALFGKALGGTNTSTVQTNQPVKVFADNFSYGTNLAVFRGNVRANALDSNLSKTSLDAGVLRIGFGESNQVQTVSATENVVLVQLPGEAANTDILKKSVTCESLTLHRSIETGWLESIHAATNVVGQQLKALPDGDMAQRITAESVTIKFLPGTNQVGNIIAERNVFAERIEFLADKEKSSQAHGERAVYNSMVDTIELTGEPTARIDNLFLHDAKVFRWDFKTGKISANPYYATSTNPTNDLRILIQQLQP